MSNPITLVRKTEITDDVKDSDIVKNGKKDSNDETFTRYNRMMQSRYKAKLDVEMSRNLMICGVGYMMALRSRDPKDFAPFELMVPDPRTTFVIYSNDVYREPVLGVTYILKEDGSMDITAYGKHKFWRFTTPAGENPNVSEFENVLHEIPIIEFEMPDRMGVFEKVIPLIDAIDNINSQRINSIEQHVQSILWLNNCEIDSEQKAKLVDGNGVIMTRSTDGKQANISYLTSTLDQQQTQSLVDYYQSQIMEISSTPAWGESSGGSTTGAQILSNGWQYLELSAKTFEQLFDEPEHRLLKVVKATFKTFLQRDFGGVEDIDPEDVEIKFNRNKTFDLITKTNALVSMLNSGIDGLEAFKTVNLFTDPEATWTASKDVIEGMQKKLVKSEEPKNIIKNANAYIDEEGKGGEDNSEKDKTAESLQPSKVAGVTE